MKNLAWIPASLVAAVVLSIGACTSNSSGGGGSGGGGSSGGSGGGTITGAGACVLYFDDAGNSAASGTAAGCIVTSVNGQNISGPPCASGLTYATACPSQQLVGCCTTRANSNASSTVLVAQCTYTAVGETAAEAQQACETPFEDGGAAGTWSTSAPQ
jgi:hypothetical protein